jgi:TonB family protein
MNPHDQWFDGIARNLIRHAARKTPAALSERLGEEWLADLAARAGALPQLRFALGCCWATTVIAREFGAPVRAAAGTSGGKTTVVDEAGPGRSFSRRTTVILVIVGLHVLVVGFLATAIVAPKAPKASPPPRIGVDFLPKPAPPKPPPPPDPTFRGITIDPPLLRWREPSPEPPITTADPVTEAPSAGPAGQASLPAVNRVMGGPGAGFPGADDFYPVDSIRLRESGIATVGVCVDAAGRLIGKPTIDRSSGRPSLDEAAVKLAKAGSGHYRATTEDGRPVSACYPFLVRFRLRD